MPKKAKLISIGDCTTDAFIRLHDASVHCDINKQNCKLCLSFADKVPYEDLTVVPGVGNSANVAVGAARLGHEVDFLSAVGLDANGRQVLDVFKKEAVGHKLVKINPGKPTNYHFVLNFQGERTILIKHQHFSYFPISRIGHPDWVFFSSIGENTLPLHKELGAYLRKNPQIKLAFNPGTFQIKMGRRKLAAIYRETDLLFLNREEAQRVLEVKNSNVLFLMRGLHKLGPKIVCITDGSAGAYMSDAREVYFMPIYPDKIRPFERTGAGDSFSAAFLSAIMHGLSPQEALLWAPINPWSVVQYTGARHGLLTKSQILSLLQKAPKSYKPKKISK